VDGEVVEHAPEPHPGVRSKLVGVAAFVIHLRSGRYVALADVLSVVVLPPVLLSGDGWS
jgi:hypothetical protein